MPEMTEEQKEFCKAQYNMAKQMLEDNGSILSSFFVMVGENYDPEFREKEGTVVAVPMVTDDKDELSLALRMLIYRVNAPVVSSIIECWATKIDPNDTSIRDRREAVMVQFETADGTWISLAYIERDGEGNPHIQDEMPEMDFTGRGGGRFGGLISERAKAEEMDFSNAPEKSNRAKNFGNEMWV